MADRSYRVLARAWRPQKFDQVVGQSAIVRTLSNALEQGRVAHAYCFSGIRGVGKTTIARLLAKGLNCRRVESPTASPCGECEACVEIEESRNLDVIELDAASQRGIDSMRQLNEFVRYTPARDRYKVFILDEAHMLTAEAFNALLKTLEEPPPNVVFMLATTEPHKILQTVLSRCQHYPLGRISQVEITGQLREIVEAERVKLSDDGIAMVAIAADGSLRDAQSLLDKLIAFGGEDIDDETVVSLLGMVDRELLFTATDLIGNQDLAGVFNLVNRMVEQGVDLHQFTLDLLGHLRALLVVATVEKPSEILHLPDGDLERLQRQVSLFNTDDLDRAFALLSASEYRIKQSEVPRYQLEMVLSRLARMPRLEPIEALIAQLRSGPGGGVGSTGGSGSGTRSRGGTGGRATGKRAAPLEQRQAQDGRPGRDQRPAQDEPPPPDQRHAQDDGPPPDQRHTLDEPPPPDQRHTLDEPPPPDQRHTLDDRPLPDQRPGQDEQQPAAGDPGSIPAAAATAAESPDEQTPRVGDSSGSNGAGDGHDNGGPVRAHLSGTAPSAGASISFVLDRLRQERPLIAKVVERADSTELRDDTLFLTFDDAGGIFRARLRDRAALAAIEEAAEGALNRKIKVVAGFGGEGEGPASTGTDLGVSSEPAPDGAAQSERDELWQRAESEPLVREFVDALRGNLTDVEEI